MNAARSQIFFFKVAYVTKVDFNYKKNSLESIPKIILSPTIKWLIWQWNPDIFLHKIYMNTGNLSNGI